MIYNHIHHQDFYSEVKQILKEAYTRPDLHFVHEFVNYLLKSETISRDYILKKWNIILELENLDDYTIVRDASYSPETNAITLYINENIDELLHGKRSKEDLIAEIKRYIFHELYHYQQGNNPIGKLTKEERKKRFKAFENDKLSSEDKKMLVQEVDAHAKDYARNFELKGYNCAHTIRSIELGEFTDNFTETELMEIALYRQHPAVWRRLLTEIYRYFQEEH